MRPAPPGSFAGSSPIVNTCTMTRAVPAEMTRRELTWLSALAVLVLVHVAPAWGQTFYVLPEPVHPVPGDEVHVLLVSGTPFGDGALPAPDPLPRLDRLWRAGRATLKTDADGMAAFTAGEAGVQLVAAAPAGTSGGASGIESYAKAIVVVGRPADSGQIWRSELGQRLEIVPQDDPVALAAKGGRFEAQILFEREPLAGVTVVAVLQGDPSGSYRRSATDMTGRVRFDLDRPGRWLVHLAHKSFDAGGEARGVLCQSSLLLTAGPQ